MSASIERCANCFRETMGGTCAHCGWVLGRPTLPPYIPVGTLLNDCYRVGRVLGHGGFGITYLGWDTHLDLLIAIKEYFPRSLATRANDELTLSLYPGHKRVWFDESLHRFQEEARILARFQRYPGIVGVYSFFRANETCYMVMEYVAGITLQMYLKHRQRLSYRTTFKILTPIMDALNAVHEVGLLHRDVSPHNIYITQQKQVKLLDFGSARFLTEDNHDPSVVVKPGFAPQEQYYLMGNQGPWTDVYGLAATFYTCLTGNAPPDSSKRSEHDELKLPSELGIEIPSIAEPALLKGLAMEIEDRFQNIKSFQQALPKPAPKELSQVAYTKSPATFSPKWHILALSIGALLSAILVFLWLYIG